jgi:hypothetical protein
MSSNANLNYWSSNCSVVFADFNDRYKFNSISVLCELAVDSSFETNFFLLSIFNKSLNKIHCSKMIFVTIPKRYTSSDK